MAYINESDEYLPDSDDSNDTDERPNRWTGPPSTWQQLNSAEIDTLTALNELRNRDLSVHLYNTFALKHRHDKKKACEVLKPVPNQDVDIATGQLVQEDKWVPPNVWTAWPLPANVVPRPEFMKRTDAADERFTFKMQQPYTPKAELEETISATMLRLAKEKFLARKVARQGEEMAEPDLEISDEEDSSVETSSAPRRVKRKSRARSARKSRSVKYESTSEGEMMVVDGPDVKERSSSIRPRKILLKTAVATDDELSYTLLRPSAQGILARLNTTLTVLHNAQESKAHCPSESETSDASSRSQSRSRSRSKGPSQNHSQSPDARHRRLPNSRASSVTRELVHPETPGGVKKRGRPKKVYPQLEGETERAYAIRIARLRKKPIPHFDDDDDPEPASDSTPAPNSAAEYTGGSSKTTQRAPTKSRVPRRNSNALSDLTSADEVSKKPLRGQRLSRVRLRDWRDILGAAALAGFPAPALDRAARRCADLFDQSFTLHTLQEGHPGQKKLDKHVRYEPGMAIPCLPEGSEDEGDEGLPQVLRGRAPRATSKGLSESEGRGRGRSRSRSRSTVPQSRSASVVGEHFCTFSNCPRAVDPFARRTNLLRHMKLIHKQTGDELPVEVDSEDEMHGAVHVDGFLQPIKIRPGWRGEDAAKEKRRPRKQIRKARSETVDTRMRDTDSTTGYETSD